MNQETLPNNEKRSKEFNEVKNNPIWLNIKTTIPKGEHAELEEMSGCIVNIEPGGRLDCEIARNCELYVCTGGEVDIDTEIQIVRHDIAA